MLTTEKISYRQMALITLLFTIGTTILVAPSTMAEAAKQDAWISTLIGMAVGCCFSWLYISVGLLYPSRNLLEMNELILGKCLGWLFSFLFVFTMFLSSAEVLYYIGNFLTTHVFPETPIQFIHILFLLVIGFAVRLGMEPFARSVEIFIPWFLFLFGFMLLLLFPKMKVENIQPVLEASGVEIAKGVLSFISITYLTAPSLLMFFPACVNQPAKAQKAFILGGLLGGFLLSLIIAAGILVLSPMGTQLQAYPSYILAQQINVGNFLQRVEAIMAIMWFITIFVKLTIYYYATVVGTAQLFRLRVYKPLNLPIGIAVVTFSLIVYPNNAYMMEWDSDIWTPYSLIFGFFYPLLLLIVGTIRKKTGQD